MKRETGKMPTSGVQKLIKEGIRAAVAKVAQPEGEQSGGDKHCSFCGLSKMQVAKLIRGNGPETCICNGCVDLCHVILHGKVPPEGS